MLRVTLHMQVKAGHESEFIQAWKIVAAHTSRVPGNLCQALLQSPQDTRSFVITSDWESPEAFHRYERSDEQDTLTAPLRALRESVCMELHHIVKLVGKGATA